jgi:hypothetical protein
MRRDFERRLVRAEISAAAISWPDYRTAQHRSSLRTRGKICDCILEYRAANGMTPELGELTRQRDEVAIELANIPDTPELCAADEAILRHGQKAENAADALQKISKMLDQIAERIETATDTFRIW